VGVEKAPPTLDTSMAVWHSKAAMDPKAAATRHGDRSRATELRCHAESALQSRGGSSTGSDLAGPKAVDALLHELEVHQIELEMQNEELRRTSGNLEASRARFADLYELAPVGYLTLGADSRIRQANLTAAARLGKDRTQLLGRPLTQFIFKDDQDVYYLHRKALYRTRRPQNCELRLLGADGTPFWVHLDAVLAEDAPGDHVSQATLTDIASQKQAEEESRRTNEQLLCLVDELTRRTTELEDANETITRIAATDDLTGLANRRHFYKSLEKAVSLTRRHGSPVAVVSFDLDGLKRVNDEAGHAAGDQALTGFAAHLGNLCRAEDLPGRLGGDEFCVLLPGIDRNGAQAFAERVLAAVRESAGLRQGSVTVSAGVAAWKPDEAADDLLRRADDALYAAKRDGGDAVVSAE
jgi:diguanylate cyclase (GGDEF)-like protein/PAS domain S-box-containing protein